MRGRAPRRDGPRIARGLFVWSPVFIFGNQTSPLFRHPSEKTVLNIHNTTIIVVFLVCSPSMSDVIMDDHWPTGKGGTGTPELDTGDAC